VGDVCAGGAEGVLLVVDPRRGKVLAALVYRDESIPDCR
jgi:hypothetical protein